MPCETNDQKKVRLQKMRQQAEKEWEALFNDRENAQMFFLIQAMNRLDALDHDIYNLDLKMLFNLYAKAEKEYMEKDWDKAQKNEQARHLEWMLYLSTSKQIH